MGNNGSANAIPVSLSSLQFTPTGSSIASPSVNLPFTTTQTAAGESASADMVVYDSLGMPLSVNVTCVLQSTTSSYTAIPLVRRLRQQRLRLRREHRRRHGVDQFRRDGQLPHRHQRDCLHRPRQRPLGQSDAVPIRISQRLRLVVHEWASLAVSSQDGSAPGTLSSYQIGANGIISGVFSNGITRDLGQIALAGFSNPAGLEQQGQNMYTAGVNSGLPVVERTGANGVGTIVGGATELSNTDVSSNLIGLITASTMYAANSRVITTTQQLYQDLLALQGTA